MRRGGPLRRKKALARSSQKQRRKLEERRAVVASEILRRPLCEIGALISEATGARFGHTFEVPTSEFHEPLTRARGGSISDPGNMIATCRGCHRWIHDNPERAKEIGLLRSSWEK